MLVPPWFVSIPRCITVHLLTLLIINSSDGSLVDMRSPWLLCVVISTKCSRLYLVWPQWYLRVLKCTAGGKATNSETVMVTWLDPSSRESTHRDMDTSCVNQNGVQKTIVHDDRVGAYKVSMTKKKKFHWERPRHTVLVTIYWSVLPNWRKRIIIIIIFIYITLFLLRNQ